MNSDAKWPFAELFDRITAQMSDRPTDTGGESMEFRRGDTLDADRDAVRAVPWVLRVGAAVSWRLIVIAIAAAGIAWVAIRLYIVVMPVAVALLLAVLIEPIVGWLVRRLHLPQTLAAVFGLLFLLGLVVVSLSQAGSSIFSQLPDLFRKVTDGVDTLLQWLKTDSPIVFDTTFLDQATTTLRDKLPNWLTTNSSTLATTALSVTSSLATIVSGVLVSLFCLFFFLKDGRQIWLWVVRLFPAPARTPLHESAIRGWVTLGSYVRTQIQVAAIDAVGIGLGAFFLGLPLVLPIVVVVFFASFVPIVGALVSGAIAVFVALVDQGVTAGIIMLVIILVVQQIESNLLQPLLMAHAVSLHPMAVLLVVAAAGSVAGIPGAVFGVPIAAFLNSTFLYLHGYDPMPELAIQEDRPGGPPGMLDDLVRASYSGTMTTAGEGTREDGATTGDAPEVPSEAASPGEDEDGSAGDDAGSR